MSNLVCGSWLADPVATYPYLFEVNSVSRGATGANWLMRFPYALPALLSALSMFFVGTLVFLIIEEVGASDQICDM